MFRRASVYEPFELQRQYEFNDAKIVYKTAEKVSSSVIVETAFPAMSYEDFEFTRDSSYIYTVCSIDAHGYLSNYGTQTAVSFDKNG